MNGFLLACGVVSAVLVLAAIAGLVMRKTKAADKPVQEPEEGQRWSIVCNDPLMLQVLRDNPKLLKHVDQVVVSHKPFVL